MNDLLTAALTVLAEESPRNTGPDFGKASPFGLLVVVLLLVGTFFLVWSMNRHLNKLPESFDPESPEPDQALDDGTVTDGDGVVSDDPAGDAERRAGPNTSQESGGQPPG